MEVRCQNCDARLSVPSVGPTKKTRCPHCGAMMLIPPAVPPPPTHNESTEKEDRRVYRRVFEPIPRMAAYAGGLLLILIVLSPFWASSVMDFFQRKTVYSLDNVAQPSVVTTNGMAGARELTAFGGVQLDIRRDDLERPFNLKIQNTRGMNPEIYAGHNAGNVEFILADFYDGILKEATLVMHGRAVAPEVIQQELIEQFGEPQTRTDENGGPGYLGLNGLRLDAGRDDVAGKLAAFHHRRALLWTDGNVRVDALIYFNDAGPAVLQVHLAATAWLQANQPALRAVGLRP